MTHGEAVPLTRYVLALTVQDGADMEFLDAWQALAAAAARHPANIEQWLTRGDDNTYFVTSDWSDSSSFATFSRSPEHDALAGAVRAVTSGAVLTRSHHVRRLAHAASTTTGTAS